MKLSYTVTLKRKEDIKVILVCGGLCFGWGMPLGLAAEGKPLGVSDFTSAGTCGSCHPQAYREWQNSAHSRAATDPVFVKMLGQAKRGLGENAVGLCLTCHAPVATVTRAVGIHEPVQLPLELQSVAREGVTCDFCHTISGAENFGQDIGMGIYRYPRRGQTQVKYGLHGGVTPHHGTGKSEKMKSGELCSICHKFGHPAGGENWQDTYAEWKEGPYAKLGVRCQDCHMPKAEGQEGLAGQEEAPAHVFVGVSTQLFEHLARVKIVPEVIQKGGQSRVRLKAEVTNVGAGHKMPTGLPGMRQMWVDLEVRDAQKKEILRRVDPIGMELLGADGQPTMPWNAVRLGKDTRIGPKKTRRTSWTFRLPPEYAAPIEATVSVRYRAISELAAEAAGIQPSPVVQVASEGVRVFPDGRYERIEGETPAPHHPEITRSASRN